MAAGDAAVEVFSVKDAIEHYERARDLLTEVRPGSRQLSEPSVRTWSTCTFSWAEPTSCRGVGQGQGGLRGDACSSGRGEEARLEVGA